MAGPSDPPKQRPGESLQAEFQVHAESYQRHRLELSVLERAEGNTCVMKTVTEVNRRGK